MTHMQNSYVFAQATAKKKPLTNCSRNSLHTFRSL